MQVALVIARAVLGASVLVLLREAFSLAVFLAFVVLLTILDQATLALESGALAPARESFLERLSGRCLV